MKIRSLVLVSLCVLAAPLFAATNVFGPKTYTVPNGAPQAVEETFAAGPACNGSMSFVLRVENDGVASAEVSINGAAVLTPANFSATTGTLEVPVRLEPSNRISVTVRGGRRDGRITLTIRQEVEQTLVERTYALSSKKQTFRETLAVADPAATWVLFVDNGDPRVAQGSIAINGAVVIDLTDKIDLARRVVPLQASNDLRVELSGDAGASISLSLRQLVDESVCAPTIAIDLPSTGGIVRQSPFHVTGTASGARDLGISVNGIAAIVDLTHIPYRWTARLDAEDGPLAITATAVAPSGVTVTTTRQVTVAIDPTLMRLFASQSSEVAPAKISFRLDNAPADATKFEADFNGDGAFEIVSATEPQLSTTYATPGQRNVTVRVTSPSGVQSASTWVTILDFGTIDVLLRQRWLEFRNALAARDVPRALQLVVDDGAREKYGPPLTLLLPQLPEVAATMDGILPVYIRGDYAKYLLTRVENGQTMGYSVYFVRDSDGLWRVAQF